MGQHKGDIMSTTTSTMSCREIISEENGKASISSAENAKRFHPENPASYDWARRHVAAWHSPNATEGPIVHLVTAVASYADSYAERYGSLIGEDYVLGGGGAGDGWASILRGIRVLLNGETGRLDCGTVDSMLVRMAQAAGYGEGEL
jgi:hypothetical protein